MFAARGRATVAAQAGEERDGGMGDGVGEVRGR
jgi:hypothetical protein